jgi:hypothetical protein
MHAITIGVVLVAFFAAHYLANRIVSSNAPFYAQTTAEDAAGVIPKAYEYPPGHITRYWSGSGSIAAAWEDADDQAAAGGAPIHVPRTTASCYEFGTALTVDYRSDVYFEPGACIKYTGSSNVVAVIIGDASNVAFSRRYDNLWVVRESQSDWVSEDNVGLRVYNAAGSHFSFQHISGFTVCFQALPTGGNGFQGNTLEFNHLYDCKVARDWSNFAGGYSNDNLIIGGRLAVFSGTNPTAARYGDRITSSDSSYLTNNNNVFLKPLIELNAADSTAEAVSVVVTHGEDNHWIDARSEGNDLTMRSANASTRNLFEAGFVSDTTEWAEQLNTSSENLVIGMRSRVAKYYSNAVFQLRDAGRKALGASGASIVIPDVFWLTSAAATRTAASDTGVTYDGDYVTIPATRGMGVGVVTREPDKELLIRRAGLAGGRLHVHAYDASGNILSAEGTVVGRPSATLTYYSNSFGGSWVTGADTLQDVYFRVSSDTAYVIVFVAGGSSAAVISNFEVFVPTMHGVRAASGQYTTPSALIPSYTGSNCTTDRTFDANTAVAAEISNVLCTLIEDLKISGVID